MESLRLPSYSPVQYERRTKTPSAPKKDHRAKKTDGPRYRDQRAEQRNKQVIPQNLNAAFKRADQTAGMSAILHNIAKTSKRRSPAGKSRGKITKSRICRNTGWKN